MQEARRKRRRTAVFAVLLAVLLTALVFLGIWVFSKPGEISLEVSASGVQPVAATGATETLTAKATKDGSPFTAFVDWKIAWKNSSSTWASGKSVTSYVTITPTSNGAQTATLKYLQPFGEQAIVTATLRDYGVSATCKVDRRRAGGELFDFSCRWSGNDYGVINFSEKGGRLTLPSIGQEARFRQMQEATESSRDAVMTGQPVTSFTIPGTVPDVAVYIGYSETYRDVLSSCGIDLDACGIFGLAEAENVEDLRPIVIGGENAEVSGSDLSIEVAGSVDWQSISRESGYRPDFADFYSQGTISLLTWILGIPDPAQWNRSDFSYSSYIGALKTLSSGLGKAAFTFYLVVEGQGIVLNSASVGLLV